MKYVNTQWSLFNYISYLPFYTNPQFLFCRSKLHHWLNDNKNVVIYQCVPDPMVLLANPCNLSDHNIATVMWKAIKLLTMSLTIHYFSHKWLVREMISKHMQIEKQCNERNPLQCG